MPQAIDRPRLRLDIPAALAPPAYQPRRPIGSNDTAMRAVLTTLDVMAGGDITDAEMRRAYGMMAAHGTTPMNVLKTIVALDRPYMQAPPADRMVCGPCRKRDLAALLGIVVGFDDKTAQSLIEKARSRENNDILTFLAKEMAVMTTTGAGLYGAALAIGKGAAGVAAKAGAIKAGGMGVGGTLAAGAAAVGWGLVTAGAGLIGIAIGAAGLRGMGEVAIDHREVLEPKFYKDQRIMAGLKNGELTLPNRAPDPRVAA